VGFPWERLRWERARELYRCTVGTHAERERTILRMTTRLEGAALDAAAERWTRLAWERPVPPDVGARQVAAATRFRLPPRLSVPTLVMLGRADRLVHPAISERIARKLRLPLAEHPDGEHDLPVDDPHWVAEQVASFERLAHSPQENAA
jgi:pimeloyl-ACP methyl ester carboxylesterase